MYPSPSKHLLLRVVTGSFVIPPEVQSSFRGWFIYRGKLLLIRRDLGGDAKLRKLHPILQGMSRTDWDHNSFLDEVLMSVTGYLWPVYKDLITVPDDKSFETKDEYTIYFRDTVTISLYEIDAVGRKFGFNTLIFVEDKEGKYEIRKFSHLNQPRFWTYFLISRLENNEG